MSEVKIQQVAPELLERLDAHITQYGFKLNRGKRTFRRKIGGVTQLLEFLFYTDERGVLIEPIIRIKIEQLESVYHQICTKKKEYFEATTTLGGGLANIMRHYDEGLEAQPRESTKFLVDDSDSFEKLVNALTVYFDQYALRYFEENSTVERADKLLNANPEVNSIHNWLLPMRAAIGLIAAKQVNNPRLAELLKIYSQRMRDADEGWKSEFERLKVLLQPA